MKRMKQGNENYRIFYFFDESKINVLVNGISKEDF